MMRLFVILFICLCSATSAVCSVSGDPESKVDYVAVLNELAKKGRDESLNAAPFYRKAAELSVKRPEEIKNEDLDEWPSELTKKKQSVLKQWIESNSNAIVQLKLGIQKPYNWNKYHSDSVWEVYGSSSYLSELRYVGHATLFRVKLNVIETGMTKGAIEDILACYRFGTHMLQLPILMEQLLGIALLNISSQTTFQCLAKTDYDPIVMGLLERGFREQFSKIQNQPINLEAEKLTYMEIIQKLFQGTEDDSKLKPDEGMFLAVRFGDLTYEYLEALTRGKTVRDIEKVYAYCKEFLGMSLWQVREKGLDFSEYIRKQTDDNPIVKFYMVNIPAISRVQAQNRANMDALLTTLTLLRYRNDKGRLPENLHELLSTEYLSQLPMDPCSDGPLVYRRTGDDFILYSLGEDFDDDGGTHSNWGRGEQGGDYVFWPVQMKSAESEN